MKENKCSHELVGLSNPHVAVAVSTGVLSHGSGSGGFGPYFQCKKCLTVFTVSEKHDDILREVTFQHKG